MIIIGSSICCNISLMSMRNKSIDSYDQPCTTNYHCDFHCHQYWLPGLVAVVAGRAQRDSWAECQVSLNRCHLYRGWWMAVCSVTLLPSGYSLSPSVSLPHPARLTLPPPLHLLHPSTLFLHPEHSFFTRHPYLHVSAVHTSSFPWPYLSRLSYFCCCVSHCSRLPILVILTYVLIPV